MEVKTKIKAELVPIYGNMNLILFVGLFRGVAVITYPASCASCARMIDNRLLLCRNSHTAG